MHHGGRHIVMQGRCTRRAPAGNAGWTIHVTLTGHVPISNNISLLAGQYSRITVTTTHDALLLAHRLSFKAVSWQYERKRACQHITDIVDGFLHLMGRRSRSRAGRRRLSHLIIFRHR